MEDVFELYGQLFNNVTVFTIEMVRSDVSVMVSQIDHIKVTDVSIEPRLKTKCTSVSDSRT